MLYRNVILHISYLGKSFSTKTSSTSSTPGSAYKNLRTMDEMDKMAASGMDRYAVISKNVW